MDTRTGGLPARQSLRDRAVFLPLLAAFMLLATIFAVPAFAVHDAGAFQLDGDAQVAVDPAPTAADDWDEICDDNSPDCELVADYDTSAFDGVDATSSSHVADVTGGDPPVEALNATIFQGGGSKDGQDITEWRWKDESGGLPDKDNLLHAYAARYTLPAGEDCPNGAGPTYSGDCSLIYFGSDRYANDGDATQAFWFLQSKIGLTQEVANGAYKFSGSHKNGDILIISEFSNGGTKSTITVYKWESGGLVFLSGGANKKCGLVADGDPFCGIVNESTTPATAPWSFLDKAGSTDFRQGEFYEAGINLSDPSIGLADQCFSSFVAETRSSTSVTAQLKDFVVGTFESCGAVMVTTPSASSVTPGTSVSDTAVVSGTGVNNPPYPSSPPDVKFYVCEPGQLTPPNTGECTTGGTQVGSPKALANTGTQGVSQAVSDPYDTTGKAPGRYCFRATWDGDENYPDGASDSGPNECFTVIKYESSLKTDPWIYPNDEATVSTAYGTDITGTVTFTLYDSEANCEADTTTGRLRAPQTVALPTTPATSKTVNTTNTTVKVESSTTVYWRVEYSGDTLHFGRLSCKENIATTLTNDHTGGRNVP